MKRKVKAAQIIASIALFAIIIGIIGTWILVLVGSNQQTTPVELTEEQLQELINSQSGYTLDQTGTGETEIQPEIIPEEQNTQEPITEE